MLRRQPLFSAVNPAVIASGLQPDRHPLQTVLWSEASGVRFYDGKVRTERGDTVLLELGVSPVRGLGQQRLLDRSRALWAVEGKNIWRNNGITTDKLGEFDSYRHDETPARPATFYDLTFFGDWAFINGGDGAVKYWNGTSMGVIPAMPTDVTMLSKKYNFLMAFGTGERKTGVSWSNADDVTDWVASRTNIAGTLYVDDFDGGIVAVSRLGESNMVYADDQAAIVTFLGEPFYFGQRVILDGIGAVGKMAVASDGRVNVGVGRGGVWLTDSNDFRYIDDGVLHDYLQENVNWAQKSKIVAARNDRNGCYDFHFPMRDSLVVNESWSFDPKYGGWAKIAPAQLQVERKLFDQPLVSRGAGQVGLLGATIGSEAPLVLRTRPLLMQVQGESGFADVHTDVRIDEVELLIKSGSNIEFRVGSSMDADNEPNWGDWQQYLQGTQTYLLPQYETGVYTTLEFRTTSEEAIIIDSDEVPLVDEESVQLVEVSLLFTFVIDADGSQLIDTDGALIVEAGESGWQMDLQGFLLFGVVDGTKR